MKLKISILSLIILLSLNFVYAKDIIYTSKIIIESSKQLDGQIIKYQGEAIGEALYRNNNKNGWVNIKDETNAIGIWLSENQIQLISIYGGYQTKGDTILVEGVFNNACSEHGGDIDIHATKIEVIEKGYKNTAIINKRIFMCFRILVIPTIIVLGIVCVLEEKNKKTVKIGE